MKIKPIVLSGAFYGTNFGDHLFAMMLSRLVPTDRVLKGASETIARDTSTQSVSAWRIARARGVIFGPGGYFGEGEQDSRVKVLRRLQHHYLPAVMARMLRIPYIITGVGVGPVKGSITRRLLRLAMEGADAVSVRDVESVHFLSEYGIRPKRLTVGADLALRLRDVLIPENSVENISAVSSLQPGSHKVFIHIEPGARSELQDLWKSVVEFLSTKNCEVYFGTDFVWRGDLETEDVVKYARDVLKLQTGLSLYKSPLDLIQVLESMDTIITHKLHVGIVGSSLGKSVVSFPIHNKTPRFYRQIEDSERCLPLADTHTTGIEEHMAANWKRPVSLPARVFESAECHAKLIASFNSSI